MGEGINRTSFYDLKVNIPTVEKQKQITNYCDNISNIIDNLEKQMEDNKQLMTQIFDKYLKQTENKNDKNNEKINVESDKDNEKKNENFNMFHQPLALALRFLYTGNHALLLCAFAAA